MPIRFVFFFLIGSPLAVTAQDLHFTQFYLNPAQFNPSLEILEPAVYQVAVGYRDQWVHVPVGYQTLGASFVQKVRPLIRHNWSIGGLMSRDASGDGSLNWLRIGAQVAASRPISEVWKYSIGASVQTNQRRVDLSKLTFLNQWNGDLFDAGAPTKELLSDQSQLRADLGLGVSLGWQDSYSRSAFRIGFSGLHLNRPELGFSAQRPYHLPIRYTLLSTANRQVGEMTDLQFYGLIQHSARAWEVLAGAGIRQIISTGPGNSLAVGFSTGFRLGDAIFPALQVVRNNWIFGLSYDINVSGFQTATQRRGGFELVVVYQVIPAPPLPKRLICPIF
jgi:type IX secretion system PorP/SprF family membrane protein